MENSLTHWTKVSRSAWIVWWSSSAEISRYMTVSSAKRRTVELTPLGRLLMHARNIAWPRTAPWKRLVLRGAYQTQPRPLLQIEFHRWGNFWPIRVLWSQCRIRVEMIIMSLLWATLSKALEKSTTTMSVCFPLCIDVRRSFMSLVTFLVGTRDVCPPRLPDYLSGASRCL